jgi:hypothetical protein
MDQTNAHLFWTENTHGIPNLRGHGFEEANWLGRPVFKQRPPRELHQHILKWAQKYQIVADWLLVEALNTMLFWTEDESNPHRRESDNV